VPGTKTKVKRSSQEKPVGEAHLPAIAQSTRGKTMELRDDALSLGTNANRALFKGMNRLSDWPRNRLLLALPSRDLRRVMPELEHIRCQRAEVLMDADSSLDHVFFPDSGVVSVVAV
jgi:hypothetical protein